MEINKKYKLEKAVSTDSLRPALQNISISRTHAMATNANILAIVPVTMAKDDTPGWLTPDALKLGRKVSPKSEEAMTITLNGKQILPDGTQMARPGNDEQPPDIAGILHSAKMNRKFKFGINVQLLKDLSDAIGSEEVVLELAQADKAILVRPVQSKAGEHGIIMPVRLNP
jgi:hypothetical protein